MFIPYELMPYTLCASESAQYQPRCEQSNSIPLRKCCAACQAYGTRGTDLKVGATLLQVVGGKEKYRAVCRGCYNGGASQQASQRRRQIIGSMRCAPKLQGSRPLPSLPIRTALAH